MLSMKILQLILIPTSNSFNLWYFNQKRCELTKVKVKCHLWSSVFVNWMLIIFFAIHSIRYSNINFYSEIRGGSRAAATFKMECFVIIVNGIQPLTINKKCSILDVAAALDPPLKIVGNFALYICLRTCILCNIFAYTSTPNNW